MARQSANGHAMRGGQVLAAMALVLCGTLSIASVAFASVVQGKVLYPQASEIEARQVMAKVYRRFPVAQAAVAAVMQYQVVVAVDSPTAAAPTAPVVVTSSGYMLEPAWVVVPVGAEVKFENQDRFALSLDISGEQRPPTLKHGESHVQKFTKPGLYKVAAREWDHMRANVLVLENKIFALPDNSGVFKIGDVQSGVKTTRIYVDGQEVAKTDIQVPADGDVWLEVKVDPAGKATPEVRGSGLVPTNGKPEANVQPQPAPKPEPKVEPKPKPKPKPRPQPKPKPEGQGGEQPSGGSEAPPPPPPPPVEDDGE